MTIDQLATFLGWSTILNWGLMCAWLLFITLARNFTYRIHAALFGVNEEQFRAIQYCGLGIYKLMVFMFNVIPYLVLRYFM